jgi:hypothetical protein
MIRIKRFNESFRHTSEVNDQDIQDLENYFSDVKDEWLMVPSKWLSNPLTAPSDFHFLDYKFYYHFYLPFDDKIAMRKVGNKSRNVVIFSIESISPISAEGLTKSEYQIEIQKLKERLLSDIEKFLDDIKYLGWNVYDFSETRDNFLNISKWSNVLEIYLYM